MRGVVLNAAVMSDFASILESVERAAVETGAASSRNASWIGARLIDPGANATPDPASAHAAYAAHGPRNEATETKIDVRTLRRAIVAANGDAERLRELRRTAARALHPDRGGDGAQLAECNALIDAALRTSRKRT